MRILIVVQSLIILVGAYYIYTLHQASTLSVTEEVVEVEVTPGESEDTPVATSTDDEIGSDATAAATSSSPSGITGASDVGMEYPIPDDEAEIQVR